MKKKGLNNKINHILPGALRFMRGLIRAVGQPSQFEIKRGYQHRDVVVLHDDSGMADEYQKPVYQAAAQLMRDNHWKTVIDIGCGSGYKLVHYLGEFNTTGVDLDWMIEKTRSVYPEQKWIPSSSFNPADTEADMIICADVIEHVEDPAAFLTDIFTIRNWKCAVISTPERDLKRGRYHFGPPPNPHHYREWNEAELVRFISKFAEVDAHYVIDEEKGTQVVICRKN